jgi:diguanylate cyclase (GGDEF)-like protein
LFLDLNYFKPVNDNYGHKAGDQVLCVVAERLRAVSREIDCAVRYGGDEFALILDLLGEVAEAETVAQRLRSCIQEPITLTDGVSVRVSASIGLAVYPDDGACLDDLLKCADQAMYRHKNSRVSLLPGFE